MYAKKHFYTIPNLNKVFIYSFKFDIFNFSKFYHHSPLSIINGFVEHNKHNTVFVFIKMLC